MAARTRWIVIALALVAAITLAIAVQGGRWWHAANIGIGPGGTRVCFDTVGCRTDDLTWLGGTELWRKAGLATMAGSLLVTLTCVALAGSLAARRRGTLAAGAALTAALTSAVAGVVFLAKFPGAGAELTVGIGEGVYLWAGGVAAAVGAAVVTLRAG